MPFNFCSWGVGVGPWNPESQQTWTLIPLMVNGYPVYKGDSLEAYMYVWDVSGKYRWIMAKQLPGVGTGQVFAIKMDPLNPLYPTYTPRGSWADSCASGLKVDSYPCISSSSQSSSSSSPSSISSSDSSLSSLSTTSLSSVRIGYSSSSSSSSSSLILSNNLCTVPKIGTTTFHNESIQGWSKTLLHWNGHPVYSGKQHAAKLFLRFEGGISFRWIIAETVDDTLYGTLFATKDDVGTSGPIGDYTDTNDSQGLTVYLGYCDSSSSSISSNSSSSISTSMSSSSSPSSLSSSLKEYYCSYAADSIELNKHIHVIQEWHSTGASLNGKPIYVGSSFTAYLFFRNEGAGIYRWTIADEASDQAHIVFAIKNTTGGSPDGDWIDRLDDTPVTMIEGQCESSSTTSDLSELSWASDMSDSSWSSWSTSEDVYEIPDDFSSWSTTSDLSELSSSSDSTSVITKHSDLSSRGYSTSSSWSSDSSLSSRGHSSSSLSTGDFENFYCVYDFTVPGINGWYLRTGAYENERPVYSNGIMYLKYGGHDHPFWFFQSGATLLALYRNDVPSRLPLGPYFPMLIGLPSGGSVDLICPQYSSSSSQSEISSQSSSISSASSESSTSSTWFPLKAYVSECYNMESVTSPLAGDEVGMTVSGHFDPVGVPDGNDYSNLNDMHVLKAGLKKTSANRGTIWCENASKLFSCADGKVLVMLSLPSPVVNGIYTPLIGKTGTLKDMVIWAVNIGDTYITPPGMYAAFTPDGIEFTIWTSAGKQTVVANTDSATFPSGTDFVLEFVWERQGLGNNKTMAIYGNSVLIASGNGLIKDDPLHHLYSIIEPDSESSDGGEEIDVHANFYMLDSKSGKNGILGIVRRIEIRTEAVFVPAGFTGGIPKGLQRSGVSKSQTSKILRAGSEISFDFDVMAGNEVSDTEVSFRIVVPFTANMQATGHVGSSRHDLGEDTGAEDVGIIVPEIPDDLPVGFEEVRGRQ